MSMQCQLRGSMPALITPFTNGALDKAALKRLVEWHIEQGTHALVPVGTTGESPTLSHEEHDAVIELVIETAAGRIPVIAGACSNNTIEAIRLAQHAQEVGADAALVIAPYYNKPTQAGMIANFQAIHDACDIPLVLYNVPSRTGCIIDVETVAELSKLPNIIGIKDATADLARPALQAAASGAHFIQLSGEDATALAFNASGGHGCISVTANVAPKLCAQMQEATLAGDFERARSLNEKLVPLHQALFIESSPAPAKYACSLLGLCNSDIRLPLVEITDSTKATIREAMRHAGLL